MQPAIGCQFSRTSVWRPPFFCNLETVSEDELANVLEHFFGSIRKKNGEEHKRFGYIAARSAIQRHLDSLAMERKINSRGEKFFSCNNGTVNVVQIPTKRRKITEDKPKMGFLLLQVGKNSSVMVLDRKHNAGFCSIGS